MRKRIVKSPAAVLEVESTPAKSAPHDDPAFDRVVDMMQRKLDNALVNGELFTTDASYLFPTYLNEFYVHERQYHNCNSCRRFFEQYGGLVTISPEGVTSSVLFDLDWDAVPESYHLQLAAVARRVNKARVTGVFVSDLKSYGLRQTGAWTHYAVKPLQSFIHTSRVQTAFQKSAEKAEDFKTVARALVEFDIKTLTTAVQLLKTDALYRSEKVLGAAEWLLALSQQRDEVRGHERKTNVLWRAVASAPAGFCHPRSSMIGTLLEDLAAGYAFDTVASRFAAKMHPLQYQRPQAAPSVGNIAQAERLVAQMGITSALRRRWARVDEIQAIWRPTAPVSKIGGQGVFGHLAPKGIKTTTPLQAGPQTMTWEKFQRTVLPTVTSLELIIPSVHGHYPFTAFTTAVDPDAQPILQWDREEQRNPFAWYLYHGGSVPSAWSVGHKKNLKVTAIAAKPSQWNQTGDFTHFADAVVFCLAECRDTRTPGLALFPETLKSELRSVRSTIEAFSNKGKMENTVGELASGIYFGKGDNRNQSVHLHATVNGVSTDYILDRWD